MSNLEKENISQIGMKNNMDRRTFCTKCFACTAGMAFLAYPGNLSEIIASTGPEDKIKPAFNKKEIRKLFIQKGSCSHLLFYLMNHAYGHNNEDEEQAIDQLAGGIAQRGYQCGMLWGTSMGVSSEIGRIHQNKDQAIALAVSTTKQVIDDFTDITGSPDCIDITNTDFSKAFSKIKMAFSAGVCFDLAHKWYPKAIKTAEKCLSQDSPETHPVSTCSSEVIRKMGGSDEEMVKVSGFAGGMGLSGNACGALSAAIWIKTLDWRKKNPEKKGYAYPGVEDILARFNEVTQGEMLCSGITGKTFNSLEEHSEFVQHDGCKKIIDALAETKTSVV